MLVHFLLNYVRSLFVLNWNFRILKSAGKPFRLFLPEKRSKINIVCLKEDNLVIDNTFDLCNHFLNFFHSKVQIGLLKYYSQDHIDNILNTDYFKDLSHVFPQFSFCDIVLDDVSKLVKILRTSSAHSYSIPFKLFELDPEYFISFLTCFFNLCLHNQIFPDCLKLAYVLPVHKSGSVTDVNNYRPISILSNVAKIFESLISNQIKTFLNDNNLLYTHQSGFRSRFSTSTCVTDLLNDIFIRLDNDDYVICVFIDFSCAFDSISRSIIIHKLKHLFNFDNATCELFNSYLINRKECVSLNGSVIVRLLNLVFHKVLFLVLFCSV